MIHLVKKYNVYNQTVADMHVGDTFITDDGHVFVMMNPNFYSSCVKAEIDSMKRTCVFNITKFRLDVLQNELKVRRVEVEAQVMEVDDFYNDDDEEVD